MSAKEAGEKPDTIDANLYKFRAECVDDVAAFISCLKGKFRLRWINISVDVPFPDCTVEMALDNATLDKIRAVMSEVVDGHVMLESLNTATEYTGDRWYGMTR